MSSCRYRPLIAAVALFVAAPAAAGDRALTDHAVHQALDGLKAAYEFREIEPMMACLDPAYEGRLEFKAAITAYFFSMKELEIIFVADSIIGAGDRCSVRLHWFKKATTSAGLFARTGGNAQFVFRCAGRGCKLLYIRGDNPFY